MIVQCRHIVRLIYELGIALAPAISGQSYKQFTLVNYDPRVVPDWKIPHITTLEY